MARIHFQFDANKLLQTMAYLSSHGVTGLTKLKIAKLLFYADKEHLNRYGRPILGDSYFCMDHGPVPSASKNMLDDAIAASDCAQTEDGCEETSAILNTFTILKGKYPEFVLKPGVTSDTDAFSRSELQVLDSIIEQYGSWTAVRLRGKSHEEPSWLKANQERQEGSSREMPFETMFDTENKDLCNSVLAKQREDAEWDSILTGAC